MCGLLLLLAGAGCSRPLLDDSPAARREVPLAAAPVGSAAHDADVRRLADADFVVRARASERLIDAGAAALPALGRRGDQEVTVFGRERVSTTRPVIHAILEDLPDADVRRSLAAGAPVVRREAAHVLGRREGWRSVVALIDATEDADASVRAAAAGALRRRTNRFFGFRAEAPPARRAEATERWRRWWAVEGRVAAEEDGADEG